MHCLMFVLSVTLTRNFIKDIGLRHTDIGRAHMIADIIAWVNNKNKEPNDIVSLGLIDEIRKTIHA